MVQRYKNVTEKILYIGITGSVVIYRCLHVHDAIALFEFSEFRIVQLCFFGELDYNGTIMSGKKFIDFGLIFIT